MPAPPGQDTEAAPVRPLSRSALVLRGPDDVLLHVHVWPAVTDSDEGPTPCLPTWSSHSRAGVRAAASAATRVASSTAGTLSTPAAAAPARRASVDISRRSFQSR